LSSEGGTISGGGGGRRDWLGELDLAKLMVTGLFEALIDVTIGCFATMGVGSASWENGVVGAGGVGNTRLIGSARTVPCFEGAALMMIADPGLGMGRTGELVV